MIHLTPTFRFDRKSPGLNDVITTLQSERLPIGSTQSAVVEYDNVTVVYGNMSPLAVGLISVAKDGDDKHDAPVGAMLAALPEIRKILEPARVVVERSVEPAQDDIEDMIE